MGLFTRRKAKSEDIVDDFFGDLDAPPVAALQQPQPISRQPQRPNHHTLPKRDVSREVAAANRQKEEAEQRRQIAARRTRGTAPTVSAGDGSTVPASPPCTAHRCHITGHPDDDRGHEQYRASWWQRAISRDKGIGGG